MQLCFSVLNVLEPAPDPIMGRYHLVSSEGFDEFLKALGVGMIKRKLANSVSPIIIVDPRVRQVQSSALPEARRYGSVGHHCARGVWRRGSRRNRSLHRPRGAGACCATPRHGGARRKPTSFARCAATLRLSPRANRRAILDHVVFCSIL